MNLEALAEQLALRWFFLAKPSSAEVLAELIKVRDAERERCAECIKSLIEKHNKAQTDAFWSYNDPTPHSISKQAAAEAYEAISSGWTAAIRKGG